MNLIEKLKEITPNISTELEHLRAYATDASQLEGTSQIIIWPKTVEEIRQIVRLANIRNFHIVPRGAGTSLEGQTIPDNSIILDLNHLDKIIGINRNEHYIITQAGVTLKRLNQVLAKYGLFFPITPHTKEVATLGGMASNNSFGKYSYQYKRFLNQVIDIDIIDGSGKVLTIKKPEKIIGTEGTLAIITQLKLKVTKLPNPSKDLLRFNNASDLLDHIKTLDKDSVLSLQYLDKNCSKLLAQEPTHQLLIEYNLEMKGKPGNHDQLRDQIYTTLHKNRYHHIKTLRVPESKLDDFLKFTRRNKLPTIGTLTPNIFQIFFTKTQKRSIKETLENLKNLQIYPLNIGKAHKQYISEEKKENQTFRKKIYDPAHVLNKGKII